MTKDKIIHGRFGQIKHVDNPNKNSKLTAVNIAATTLFLIVMAIYAIKSI